MCTKNSQYTKLILKDITYILIHIPRKQLPPSTT